MAFESARPKLDGQNGTRSTNPVTNEGQKQQAFNESAVLEELERLRSAISQARTTREEKVAEFELFMRNARMAARKEAMRAAGIPVDDDPAPPPEPPALVETPSIEEAAEPQPWVPAPMTKPHQARSAPLSRLDDLAEATAAFPDPPPRRRSLDRIIVAAGAGVLILALLIVSRIGWDSEQAALRSAQPASSSTPSNAAAQTPSAAPQAGGTPDSTLPAPDPSKPLQVELIAVRPVWMRVTVDDEVVVERLVPKDQRLRFSADRAIVIRAGDAGGIALSVDGQVAAPLGRDGQTVTRTLVPRSK
jgi:uncharacterized protein DUF4115